MRHGEDDASVGARAGRLHQIKAVFALGFRSVHPRVVDIDLQTEVAQFLDHIDDAGVAQIGAIFLELQAKDQ